MERHRFDPISFVFGALFMALALLALADLALPTPVDLAWIAPILLVILGLVLMLGSARRGDRRRAATGHGGSEPGADAATTEAAETSGRSGDSGTSQTPAD